MFASKWVYSAGRAPSMRETKGSASPIRETLHSFVVLSTSRLGDIEIACYPYPGATIQLPFKDRNTAFGFIYSILI